MYASIRQEEQFDIAFTFCCSNNVPIYIQQFFQSQLNQQLHQLLRTSPSSVRFALVPYYDYCMSSGLHSQFMDLQSTLLPSLDFTLSLQHLTARLNSYHSSLQLLQQAYPLADQDFAEDACSGMERCAQLSWRLNATKVVIHVADSPCHGVEFHGEPRLDRFTGGDVYGRDMRRILLELRDTIKVARYQFMHLQGCECFTQRMVARFRDMIKDVPGSPSSWLHDSVILGKQDHVQFFLACVQACQGASVMPKLPSLLVHSPLQPCPPLAKLGSSTKTFSLLSNYSESLTPTSTQPTTPSPHASPKGQREWVQKLRAEVYAYHVPSNCSMDVPLLCEVVVGQGAGLEMRKVGDVQLDFQVAPFATGLERSVHKVGRFRVVGVEDDSSLENLQMRLKKTSVQVVKMQRDGCNSFERVEKYARRLAVSNVVSQHFNRVIQEKQIPKTGRTDYHMFINFRDLYILKTTLNAQSVYLILEPALHHAVSFSHPPTLAPSTPPKIPSTPDQAAVDQMGRELAAGFSHYTYAHTAANSVRFLITDIKGMMIQQKQDSNTRRLACADPTIYAWKRSCGEPADGVRRFLNNHVCGEVCRHLQLEPLKEGLLGGFGDLQAQMKGLDLNFDLPAQSHPTSNHLCCPLPTFTPELLASLFLANPSKGHPPLEVHSLAHVKCPQPREVSTDRAMDPHPRTESPGTTESSPRVRTASLQEGLLECGSGSSPLGGAGVWGFGAREVEREAWDEREDIQKMLDGVDFAGLAPK